MAAVLEGDAVHIFQSIDTSNLPERVRIDYLYWQVFSLRLCHWERESLTLHAKFIHLLLGYCRDKADGKSAVINSGILY